MSLKRTSLGCCTAARTRAPKSKCTATSMRLTDLRISWPWLGTALSSATGKSSRADSIPRVCSPALKYDTDTEVSLLNIIAVLQCSWNSLVEGLTGEQSLYTEIDGNQIMFHVSTMLPFMAQNDQQVRAPSPHLFFLHFLLIIAPSKEAHRQRYCHHRVPRWRRPAFQSGHFQISVPALFHRCPRRKCRHRLSFISVRSSLIYPPPKK